MKLKYYDDGISIFKSDNLELLKTMKDESINLIYCDVLYNSGKKFDDYNDDLGTPLEAVEWYRPRIEEMHRVLAKNGSIYIHCNWRMDSYLRILMDEVFGRNHFKNRIYRQHSDIRGFVKNYDSQVDTILYYVKNTCDFTFNELKGDKLRIIPLIENGLDNNRNFEFCIEEFKFNPALTNKHWLVSKQVLVDLYMKRELQLINGIPHRVTNSIPIGNLWNEPEMFDSYSRIDAAESYDTPKPNALLNRIIRISSNENDVVADFFMGGGTTVEETIKLNRKGFFCDISEKACDVTINKISKIKKGEFYEYDFLNTK